MFFVSWILLNNWTLKLKLIDSNFANWWNGVEMEAFFQGGHLCKCYFVIILRTWKIVSKVNLERLTSVMHLLAFFTDLTFLCWCSRHSGFVCAPGQDREPRFKYKRLPLLAVTSLSVGKSLRGRCRTIRVKRCVCVCMCVCCLYLFVMPVRLRACLCVFL